MQVKEIEINRALEGLERLAQEEGLPDLVVPYLARLIDNAHSHGLGVPDSTVNRITQISYRTGTEKFMELAERYSGTPDIALLCLAKAREYVPMASNSDELFQKIYGMEVNFRARYG